MGEFPIGAWATFDRRLTEEKSTAPELGPNLAQDALSWDAGAFFKA
jgi:hypothetical protein